MGCCFSTENVKIALKIPNSESYLEVKKTCFTKKLVEKEDINIWIKNIYKNKLYTQYIVYNDELNGKSITHKGHCKGILSWNKKEISWLIHSIPNFPEQFDGMNISNIKQSSTKYGQSFIFIDNIPINKLNELLENLIIMNPNICITNVDYNNIKNNIKEKIKNKKMSHVRINNKISHIAKSKNNEIDIYEHLANEYGGMWICKTWIRGKECENTMHVKNSVGIQHKNIKYNSSQDHSKYAFNNDVLIIGDLNRMTSQYKRGGGGIILKSKKITKILTDITQTEKCT